MGEMADYFLQQVVEEECAREDFARGAMSLEDAFERGFVNSQGVEQEGMEEAHDRVPLLDAEGIDKELQYLTTFLDSI
jgi:hypothetical protein